MFFPDTYEFYCPVKINSGKRALENLPVELDALNARKPLIISDKEHAKKGVVTTITDALKDSGMIVGIFDGVPPAPDRKLVRGLMNRYRDTGCDSIVAVGEGAVADTAKALNIVVSGRPEDLQEAAGADRIQNPLGPFVFIPILSGTGFEASRYASLEELHISSHYVMPDLVIIDPRIVKAQAAEAVVSTSMVALAHSAQAYTCPAKNPMNDTYAYTAIQFIGENLVNVIRYGDKQGRLALANAAILAGIAFSNSPRGMIHELGWVTGDISGLSHGICMGILLPYILEYHLDSNEYHMSDMLLPIAGAEAYAGTAENLKARMAINLIYDMQHDIHDFTKGKIPLTLKEAGISKDALDNIAGAAVVKGHEGFTADDCRVILNHAWEGTPILSS
ncbi:MAG TPA: iron-containing alcohol dehydrogenase [Syntrophales bacterium]|nr:iron-containing alcohol dehydrogenase [Syntrophales bacterium]HPQ44313.1 iron-containing alcohol dehydrogenase [Syntrophales bacterium]